MEERMIEDEKGRKIKLGVNAEGETDALEETGEEVLLELPEEEYDESLVGLTPSQLEQELERRRAAEAEALAAFEALVQEGDEALAAQEFERAETAFAQAETYVFAEESDVSQKLWRARTREFSDEEAFYRAGYAEEFAQASPGAKAFVREQVASRLTAQREEYEKEEAEIAPRIESAQAERRGAFAANRRYWSVRFALSAALIVLFAAASAVCGGYIVRTKSNLPVIFTAVFAALAVLFLIVMFVFARKLFVANGLYRENEKLSSTQEGARLDFLRTRLHALALILDD